MFNWLGNLFPYSDLHSLNLDWILSKMKETAAQAAQAIADSAKALAQVAEAKAAALSAQTAAQNAQTAANNAQTAADNAATSAENAVTVAQAAKSAAQTAQNTADAAKSAAQTAQNTANTAQSAAQTANTGVEALNAKFPIKTADIENEAITGSKIKNQAVTVLKLETNRSIIYLDKRGVSHLRFPKTGSATGAQIAEGIVVTNDFFLNNVRTELMQISIEILESGSKSKIFKCESYPALLLNKSGTVAILPFTIFNDNTNEMYNGHAKISMKNVSGSTNITCKVIFETNPPFDENTGFVIEVSPLYSQLSDTP